MGIFDKLNFSKKKKQKTKSFKDIENGLPEDLNQLKPRQRETSKGPTNPFDIPDEDDFLGAPAGPTKEKDHEFKRTFSGEEFGFSNPNLADHDLRGSKHDKDDHDDKDDDFRENADTRHKIDLILSKLETMNARLKLIEERMKRR
jgi:hypothetical protein